MFLPFLKVFPQTLVFGLLIPPLYQSDSFGNAYDYPDNWYRFPCSRYFLHWLENLLIVEVKEQLCILE